ncbi:MAG TPA: iron ABC transporter permease [Accumulibacter sp.]|nr:iron ABC transporter permease [Accumulibacter sp.]HMW16769.1 iron ABC transporter permease [Accumulibacter sp.]HMX23501.1 iron ABC transporter permease [Accumulibacter sp.]HNC17878.1 iron ABC transporter permease [Accumulibacter sp.]HND80713.1 iron ABC transporter permease [Accumulibacter sp.]
MSRTRISPLLVISLLTAAVIGLPVAHVFTHLFSGGTRATWAHLAATVLPDYLFNTVALSVPVAVGVVVVGVACAWLTAMHDFPGRRLFEWALILPMAMPAYVLAYVYTDFLQFSGPLQSGLREFFQWRKGDYWFPDVRSLGGAAAMFVGVLYPYVYLLTRTAFLERASGMLEVSRTLGCGPWRGFFRVSLPLARPAIVAGMTLALMETLADYGTVAYFGVQTFTTGIYRAWFSLGDRLAAAQLAAALLSCVAVLLFFERLWRGHARFNDTTGRHRRPVGHRLSGWRGGLAAVVCALPLGFGFLLPAALLLRLVVDEAERPAVGHFLVLARHSVLLAGLTALLAVVLAVLLAYGARLSRGRLAPALNRLVGLGYAVPGSVIAVGVLIPVTRLDHWLNAQWQLWFGSNPGLILTGGIAALIYAYLVRFLAVALQSVDSSLGKITANMDDAARGLGLTPTATLRRVHLPMLRGSVFSATLLVFVDVMKELPATLVMRPFDFDTLATQAYNLAADERLAEAASVSLGIVAVGLLPLIVLSRQIVRSRR